MEHATVWQGVVRVLIRREVWLVRLPWDPPRQQLFRAVEPIDRRAVF